MQTVDVHETNLNYLLSRVDEGETIVLQRNGSPIARLTPEISPKTTHLPIDGLGFLKGKISVPNDIKTQFTKDIEEMYYGNPNIEPHSGE